MVYKIISYKYSEEGEVLRVLFDKPSRYEYDIYEIEECEISELDNEEKNKLLESMCLYLKELKELKQDD